MAEIAAIIAPGAWCPMWAGGRGQAYLMGALPRERRRFPRLRTRSDTFTSWAGAVYRRPNIPTYNPALCVL